MSYTMDYKLGVLDAWIDRYIGLQEELRLLRRDIERTNESLPEEFRRKLPEEEQQ